MEDDAFYRVEITLPGCALECLHGGLISRVPAGADSIRGEVDVLGVVLVINARHQEADNMHLRDAAVAGQLAHHLAISLFGRYLLHQLADDMAQAVALLLTGDMAGDPTRILNVFLPVKNFPDCARHRPRRIPQVNREDKRVSARIVVEDHLGWRIGENAAVPIELVIDAYGWKRQVAELQMP